MWFLGFTFKYVRSSFLCHINNGLLSWLVYSVIFVISIRTMCIFRQLRNVLLGNSFAKVSFAQSEEVNKIYFA